MVESEVVALLASSTLLVHVAALVSVALTHGALDGRGDVAGGGRRARLCLSHLRGTPAGSSRPPQATSLEPFELLGDGLFDDHCQITVAPFGAHQRLEPFQLVVELGAGRELHLVPARGQGLDDGGRRRRVLPPLRVRCRNSVWTEFKDRHLTETFSSVRNHERASRG